MSNEARREKYRKDDKFREAERQRSKENYRKKQPLRSPSTIDFSFGKEREVSIIGRQRSGYFYCTTFTIKEAAQAVGKTYLTLKRWVDDGLIPEPILKDSIYEHRHFSISEVKALHECLIEHEKFNTYLNENHEQTLVDITQSFEAIRRTGSYCF